MVDLGYGDLEAGPDLFLETLQDVALVLQRAHVRQVQLDQPQRDARCRHSPLLRGFSLERARHFLARVDLEDVSRLNPVDAVDADPALESGEHLTDLVREALER